jgi:predicted DNA binding CopG/RHH family protein
MAKAKTAEEFDRRFDQGEDIFDLADIKPDDIKRPGLEYQRINIDIPAPMLQRLDYQAALRGITRQSLIKTWLYERLTSELADGRASVFYNQLRIAWVNALRNLGNAGGKKELLRIAHAAKRVSPEELGVVLERFLLESFEQEAKPVKGLAASKESKKP